MLKTLTEYLKTFADTGSGCLGAALRSCRGLQGLSLRESRSWGSSGALLHPAAASFCTNTTCAGQQSRACPGVLGQRGQSPPEPP